MVSIVVDLGNSRLKWARVGPDGTLLEHVALPLDQPARWGEVLDRWVRPGEPSRWAISTVNPPVAEKLRGFLAERGIEEVHWLTSGAQVPLKHALSEVEACGTDRALAVLGALAIEDQQAPGLIVLCGSAIVVECIGDDGVWQGGAIAPGLGLSARGLHSFTAQLPLITVDQPPVHPWGHGTQDAMEAGVFWGAVGTVRELLHRQADGLRKRPWLIWSGGDAELLAPWIEWEGSRVVADLVLIGLARRASEPGTARVSS